MVRAGYKEDNDVLHVPKVRAFGTRPATEDYVAANWDSITIYDSPLQNLAMLEALSGWNAEPLGAHASQHRGPCRDSDRCRLGQKRPYQQ